MPARTGRWSLSLGLVVVIAAGCGGTATEANDPAAPLQRLELQVRNSGMEGGYLWLGITGGAGRWHKFGMAEFLCVTCPVPFGGSGPSYEIAVFDEQCQLRAREHAPGGSLQVAIDLGPRISLVAAPPITDWMPGDSLPMDEGEVPCVPS